MSVVIVGGHDRMVGQYKKLCKSYKCKAKIFTQITANYQVNEWEVRFDYPLYKYSFAQNGALCGDGGTEM